MCEKCYHVRFPVDRKSYPRPLFIRGRWFWRRSEMLIKSVTRAPTKQVLFLILGVYIEVGGGGGEGGQKGGPRGPLFTPPKPYPLVYNLNQSRTWKPGPGHYLI